MQTHEPQPTAPTIVPLSTPGELAAAVPYLVGFRPRESLVAISVKGPRGRSGLVMRIDLPDEPSYANAAALVAGHLAGDGARQAVLVVYPPGTEAFADRPYRTFVGAVRDALIARQVELRDAVLVRDGRWASYLCDDPACCPPSGTELIERDDSPVAAAEAMEGRVVLDDRTELARLLEHDDDEDARAVGRALEKAPRGSALAPRQVCDRELLDDELARRGERWGASEPDRVGAPLPVERVATLGHALFDPTLRDHVIARWLRCDPDAYEPLWLELTRRLPAPFDARPATVLGMTAYARGDGAFARTCLEHAQASDPHYAFAALLIDILGRGVRPADLLPVLRKAFADLELSA